MGPHSSKEGQVRTAGEAPQGHLRYQKTEGFRVPGTGREAHRWEKVGWHWEVRLQERKVREEARSGANTDKARSVVCPTGRPVL